MPTGQSLATQGRVQPLPSPGQSPGRARSPLWWVWPRFSLCCRGRARRHGRRKAEAERRRGAVSPYQSKAGSGREPTQVGASPCSACASIGAQCCKGVAGPKLSGAGEGAASPYRVKPWSGWEPTRVGQAQIQPARPKARKAVWASPGRSLAKQGRVQPLPTGQRPVLAWGLLGWCQAQTQPARLKARQPVKARAVLRRGGSSASCRAKPCSGREPTCVGSSPAPACALEGAPGEGVAGQGPSNAVTALEGTAAPHRAKPAKAGCPLDGALPNAGLRCARQTAKAWPGKT